MKDTKIISIEMPDFKEENFEISQELEMAKELILNDELVAFPTETVYGLGANALSKDAVKKIFIAKNRPQGMDLFSGGSVHYRRYFPLRMVLTTYLDNPLIIHVSSRKMLDDLIHPNTLPQVYEKVLDSFWPGSLTILIQKPKCIPECVSGGQETIAVRIPAHPIARALISHCNVPLAAPSANTSGRPSPTLANHVYDDLKGRIPLIIDGGSCQSGVESTVLDGLRTIPAILRPGGVTVEALETILGKVQVYKKDFEDKEMEQAPTTPGMKYRHYSPNCSVVLVEAHALSQDTQLETIKQIYETLSLKHERIGVLLVNPSSNEYPIQDSLGNNAKEVAQSLFLKLREMESHPVSVIIVQGIPEDNEGLAVMNRLRKAASILK